MGLKNALLEIAAAQNAARRNPSRSMPRLDEIRAIAARLEKLSEKREVKK
jgi:hypothetical protein